MVIEMIPVTVMTTMTTMVTIMKVMTTVTMMTVTTSVMTNVTVMTVSSQSIASHMYSNQEHRSMQHGWLTTMYRTAAILEAMAVIAIRAASPILKTLNGMDMVWPLNCTPHKAVCAAVLRC